MFALQFQMVESQIWKFSTLMLLSQLRRTLTSWVLRETEDEEDSDTVMDRPQMLTTRALKKGLQMLDILLHHLCEVSHFMDRCLKFKHAMPAVVAPFREMYKDIQKCAWQSNINPPSHCSSLLLHHAFYALCSHIDIFQPGTMIIICRTPAIMFSCLLIINSHVFSYPNPRFPYDLKFALFNLTVCWILKNGNIYIHF